MSRYHHGDLRAALIDTSFTVLAESGLPRFSVAAVARRLGVSSAAPYRHFPDRAHLLGAVSARAARELRTAIDAAASAAGHEPADRLAALAGVYLRHVTRTGAGFPVIYAAELRDLPDPGRRDETRALMDTLQGLITLPYAEGFRVVESVVAMAHGYAAMAAEGFFGRAPDAVDDLAARAEAAARALISS